MYHLHTSRESVLRMPINQRKWLIDRFILQKNKEHEAMESARKKSKSKH